MISRARFKLTGLAFLYGLVAWFALCSHGVSAQSGFQLKAGEGVRAYGGADPLAVYGVGQYVFNRCVYPAWYSTTTPASSGIYVENAMSPLPIGTNDGGIGTRYQRMPRSVATFGSVALLPPASSAGQEDGFVWRGPTALDGMTAWLRFGVRTLGSRSTGYAGLFRRPASCATSGDFTTNAKPVGVWFECKGDGGTPSICSASDAGLSCSALTSAFQCNSEDGGAAGSGYDFIINNTGSNSFTYSYTLTAIDTGETVSGEVINPDRTLWWPTIGACRASTAPADLSPEMNYVTVCVGSNW